jgi:2,3-diketo-5-methylthio-1-phosphopentane phosphatase
MLAKFSRDERWLQLEKKWQQGLIGSRACLKGQLSCLSLAKDELDRYLRGIRLDPYFKRLYRLLVSRKIKTFILSDNFDYIIKRILERHGLKGLRVYANRLRPKGKTFITEFPFSARGCFFCAHCKKKNLLAKAGKDSIIIYIGDGRSDICPARHADIVFAKDELLQHYRLKTSRCRSYRSLRDIYNYFTRSLHEHKTNAKPAD